MNLNSLDLVEGALPHRPRSARDVAASFRFGDRYACHCAPVAAAFGGDVGFVVRLDLQPRWRSAEDWLAVPRRGAFDLRLADLREMLDRRTDDDDLLRGAALDAACAELGARRAELDADEAVQGARVAMHHDFDRPLYMRHFAEITGVHEATFTRRFAARFGTTPTRYRTLLRLSEAALLLATQSKLTVREIAARVGFEDVPYFHRAFAAQFGVTPLALGRALSAPPPSG